MPFRAALMGMLQRRQSSSSTRSTSRDRRTGESGPRSSGIASTPASKTDILERGTSVSSVNVEANPTRVRFTIDEEILPFTPLYESIQASNLDILTTTAEAQNPGPSSHQPLALADDVKLQSQTPSAEPTPAVEAHPCPQQQESGDGPGEETRKSSLLFFTQATPTPDRIDSHVHAVPEPHILGGLNSG